MVEGKKQFKRELAAGGVVFKKEDRRVFVLLINPKGPNYGPATGKWTFPKGLLEDKADKSKEEVALSEVREEGGVDAVIRAPLGYIKFFRTSKEYGNALKFVDYWLMEYQSGHPDDHDEEVAEAKWFALEDAEATLAWPHDREVLTRAKKFLDEYAGQ